MTVDLIAQDVCNSLCDARSKLNLCSSSLSCWKRREGGCPFCRRLFLYIKNGFVDTHDPLVMAKLKTEMLSKIALSNLSITLLNKAEDLLKSLDLRDHINEYESWKKDKDLLFNTASFAIDGSSKEDPSTGYTDRSIRN